MTVRPFARGCRVVLPALLLVLLMHPRSETVVHAQPPKPDDPPPKAPGNGWTFDEARDRLALSPRDPYLQYVVLQLGRRDGREREAYDAVERRSLIGGLIGRGRQQRADLFATFTGALAIQESLQLDTMRGEQPNARPPGAPDPRGPQTRPGTPARVAVSKLTGPTVPSHPWEKMLAGKKPDVGPLAGNVPEEFYFAEFRSAVRLHEVLGAGELWAGHVFTQALGGARSQLTADRIRKQLGLGGIPPDQLDRLGVEAIAITGSDPFLSEGSDVTLLVQGKNIAQLAALVDAAKGGADGGEYAGIAYTHRSTPDGAVNVYAASPRPELHVRGNSLPAFRRVLEAVAGKTADGKPAKRLGESPEFKYVRTRMVRGAEEDGFVYLSDSFIRRLTGPQLKLTERRRVMVYNHLRMIGHAALLFRTEHGRPPKSLEELAESKCAPGVFGRDKLAHPDGGTYALTADGMSAVCSKYGRAESLSPCIERLVTEVSGEEAEEYKQFVAEYSEYWRTFFDPIAIRVSVTPKQYKLETLVLPLIDNSIYTELARGAGKPAPMDLLPTPKREIGGVWVHLPKQQLLEALGPDQPAKEPGPGGAPAPGAVGAVRQASERMQASNNLKQIGLALYQYHDTHELFPGDIKDKAGKPLLSWRVAILPYIEQDALYRQFKLDEPWDSDNNKPLTAKMPTVYAARAPGVGAGKTPFVRPAGKGTLLPPDKKFKIGDVTDGSSNTVFAVEASEAAVEWTKPADITVDPKQPFKGLVRKDGEPFLALLADGSVRTVPPTADPVEFVRAIDPTDGKPGSLDEAPRPDTRPKAPFEVQNDLKQIAIAAHSYHDAMGQLPTTNLRDKAGKPLLSWRVAILPYIEQDALYRQFKLDEPWDSDNNKKLIEKMPRIYYGADAKLNAAGKSAYLVPSGRNTLSPPDGAKLTLAAITDGTANTVLAVLADPERAVVWTKPDDLAFDAKDPLKGLIRPGQEGIDVVMADGSVKRYSARIDPKKFAAMVTPTGGEVVTLEAGDDLTTPRRGPGAGPLIPDFRPTPEELRRLEEAGVDLNKLRRFVRDGIGDQVGFHMHDAPRLLDSDLSGLFGGSGTEDAGLSALGMLVRFAFGASSVSIPVKDAKIVDEYLDELDKLMLSKRKELTGAGLLWRREVDFYRVSFPKPHTIRCLVVNIAGLKWRVYWGRIGDGLYVATRPFILEDIAAAQADGQRPAKTEPAHAVLRIRPENWNAVLPGYNLGWAESNRSACHANLDTISNVARGWNDRPAAGPPSAELLGRVGRVYGERPYCPDGGTYELSADGRSCRCSVHGGQEDPRQPAAPSAASSTGKLLKSFGGLTATMRFEEDGLRVVVTMDRKE